MCGLLTDDIVNGGEFLPHIIIIENELRRLKNDSAERAIPIAPALIAFGFLDYVEAIRATGSKELFPELWVNEGKRGGDQFYSIVWSKLIKWLEQQGIEIPVGSTGKKADFHSIRSAVLSQLDRTDINQNIVADIAGHARTGVTASTYQDLVASGGLNDALAERLSVLARLPDLTAAIKRCPPALLPLNLRSR